MDLIILASFGTGIIGTLLACSDFIPDLMHVRVFIILSGSINHLTAVAIFVDRDKFYSQIATNEDESGDLFAGKENVQYIGDSKPSEREPLYTKNTGNSVRLVTP